MSSSTDVVSQASVYSRAFELAAGRALIARPPRNALFGSNRRATPPAVVARLNKEVRAVLALPDVSKRLTDMGGTVAPTSPDEARRHVEGEIAKWRKIVAERKIEVMN